jgi:hypothetical protein
MNILYNDCTGNYLLYIRAMDARQVGTEVGSETGFRKRPIILELG